MMSFSNISEYQFWPKIFLKLVIFPLWKKIWDLKKSSLPWSHHGIGTPTSPRAILLHTDQFFILFHTWLYLHLPSRVESSGPLKKLFKTIRRFRIHDSKFDLMNVYYPFLHKVQLNQLIHWWKMLGLEQFLLINHHSWLAFFSIHK